MARLFTAEHWEDDETEIKIGMTFKKSQISEIIKALKNIEDGKEEGKDGYLVLDSKQDDEIELRLQFE